MGTPARPLFVLIRGCRLCGCRPDVGTSNCESRTGKSAHPTGLLAERRLNVVILGGVPLLGLACALDMPLLRSPRSNVGCVKSSERTMMVANIPAPVRSEDSTHPTSLGHRVELDTRYELGQHFVIVRTGVSQLTNPHWFVAYEYS